MVRKPILFPAFLLCNAATIPSCIYIACFLQSALVPISRHRCACCIVKDALQLRHYDNSIPHGRKSQIPQPDCTHQFRFWNWSVLLDTYHINNNCVLIWRQSPVEWTLDSCWQSVLTDMNREAIWHSCNNNNNCGKNKFFVAVLYTPQCARTRAHHAYSAPPTFGMAHLHASEY